MRSSTKLSHKVLSLALTGGGHRALAFALRDLWKLTHFFTQCPTESTIWIVSWNAHKQMEQGLDAI